MSSDSYDATRDPRTGRPALPIEVEKTRVAEQEKSELIADNTEIADHTETDPLLPGSALLRSVTETDSEIQFRQSTLENLGELSEEGDRSPTEGGQRPEALAQFAESAREDSGETLPKELTANAETAPIPTDNVVKHEVATQLLNDGAHGLEPDPDAAGEDRLPDRINTRP
jgi:hypothetical protein